TTALAAAQEHGFRRIALLGASDLAEIAAICALDSALVIVAVVDAKSAAAGFAGPPVGHDLDVVAGTIAVGLLTRKLVADPGGRPWWGRRGSGRAEWGGWG